VNPARGGVFGVAGFGAGSFGVERAPLAAGVAASICSSGASSVDCTAWRYRLRASARFVCLARATLSPRWGSPVRAGMQIVRAETTDRVIR
jgi:hypothetical protein